MDSSNKKAPLPLVLGVTGHRDLKSEDLETLRKRVKKVLDEIRDQYRHSPLVLLSCLAEGADRLVASVAIECGIKLVVPLPMTQSEYEKDFIKKNLPPENQPSVAEFRSLLNSADLSFTLPVPDQVETRDDLYARAGAYVVQQSQIMIALWDWMASEKTGGTAQVVKFMLEGLPQNYLPEGNMLDDPELSPVYHIITPRVSRPDPPEKFEIRRTFTKDEETYDRLFRAVDEFNKDVVHFSSRPNFVKQKENSALALFPAYEALPPSLQEMRDAYGLSDALALHYQRKITGTLWLLLGVVILAAVGLHVYAHLVHNRLIYFGYFALLVFPYGMYFYARWRNYQNKHQDYRALAEGLRVQFFWRLAGIGDHVADQYLRKQRSEMDWIRDAIRYWFSPFEQEKPEAPNAQRMQLVCQYWVESQKNYFHTAAKREDHRLHRVEKGMWLFLLLGFALTTYLAVTLIRHPVGHGLSHEVLITLIGLTPIVAGLLHFYVNKKALAEHTKQYERMSILFNNAARHLRDFITRGDTAAATALVSDLGKEALRENGDWLLLHRERPLEVPKA